MKRRITNIAEVGMRVKDLDRMVAFYRDVLGFEVQFAFPTHVFMIIGELDTPLGEAGHPQVLGFFARDLTPDVKVSTLDHLAFEVPPEFYDEERARFEAKGMIIRERAYPDSLDWRGRSFFFYDPEGNVVEIIAAGGTYD